jgi:predicted metalloendopeptidase
MVIFKLECFYQSQETFLIRKGFDSMGRFYDENGNFNNSWSDETVENFIER